LRYSLWNAFGTAFAETCLQPGRRQNDRYKQGDVKGENARNIWKVNMTLSDSKVYVDDRSLVKPAEILSQCRRLPSIAVQISLTLSLSTTYS
jgi:hypothetical protein